MSHIFDALQGSEAERSGADLSAPSQTTELLRRAERQAASQWETAIQLDQSDSTEAVDQEASSGLRAASSVMTALEASLPTEIRPGEEHAREFGNFHSLQVALRPQSRLVCVTDGESPAAEAFRLLGVRLRYLRRERPLKKVLITSTIPQEGKSMVSANLACVLAQRAKQKTLLLEGDIRRPSLSKLFGLGRNPGICECLQTGNSLAKSVYHLDSLGLWFLPAGSAPNDPLELLQSGRLSSLMDQAMSMFDWIIIDSPPVLPLADTSVWTRMADGILLVTRQGTTEKRQLMKGIEAIEPHKLIGAVLNCSHNSAHSDYYYRPSIETRPDDDLTN